MSPDLSRRRILLAAAAAGVTGLAGCTSGGQPSGGGDADGTPTATATATVTANPTSTATATDDPTPTEVATENTAPTEASDFCAPIAGSPTPFDVSGMPYVFAFDYVDSWSLGEPIEQSSARYDRLVSPVVSGENGESNATIRVGQSFEALTKAEAEQGIQDTLDAYDSATIAYEETFDGETVQFVQTSNAGLYSYAAYLPYGEGERRYYFFSVVAYNENAGQGRDIGDCSDQVNVATETIRGSLTVNAETTIDQQ